MKECFKTETKKFIYLLLLIPSIAFGNEICPKAQSTREIADCLIIKTNEATAKLEKYLRAAKNRFSQDTELVRLIDKSQQAWIQYKEQHCNAVYQNWSEGTIRLIYHPHCLLYTTKARTYDVWREFLTYQDSTPPILPEPELILYQR